VRACSCDRSQRKKIGNWFRDACEAASVPSRAHGMRKAGATRAANNGATEAELEAISQVGCRPQPELGKRHRDNPADGFLIVDDKGKGNGFHIGGPHRDAPWLRFRGDRPQTGPAVFNHRVIDLQLGATLSTKSLSS
jgi:hypothetical protein